MGRAVFHAGPCLPDDGGNDFRIHPPARLLKPAVTLGASEPCVGGGAMVIALARELRSQGINY